MEIETLKFCGIESFNQLIHELFLEVPGFLKDLAPDGLDNTIYHTLFHQTAAQRYEIYTSDIKDKLAEKINSLEPNVKIIVIGSFDELKWIFDEQPLNISLEFLNILYPVVATTFMDEISIIHDKKGTDYNPSYHLFDKTFMKASKQHKMFRGRAFTLNKVTRAERYTYEVSLAPFYNFVLRFLKNKGLDIYYHDPYPSEIDPLYLENGDIDEGTNEDYDWLCLPSDMVKAYLEVYGSLPEGYVNT